MKIQKFEPLSGKVINMASIAGVRQDINIPLYSIAKAGVIMLTRLLAEQLAPKMTANSIAPGYHLTGVYHYDPQVIKDIMKVNRAEIPLKKIGTVEDVVKVATFLASPLSDYMTGENIIVDGGILKIGVPPHI